MEILDHNEICAIFILSIVLEHNVSHIMLLSVLSEMGNGTRVH